MAKYLKGQDGTKIACGRILGFETDYRSNHYNGYLGTIYAVTGKKAKTPLCTLFTHNDEGSGLYAFDEKLSRKLEDIVLAKNDPTIDVYNVPKPEFSSKIVGRHAERNGDVPLNQLMNNELDFWAYRAWNDSCNRTHSDVHVNTGELYELMDKKGTVEDRHFMCDPSVKYGVPVVSDIRSMSVNDVINRSDSKDSWHIAGVNAYTDVLNDKSVVHPGVFIQSPYKTRVMDGNGNALNGYFGVFVESDSSNNLKMTHLAVGDVNKQWSLLDKVGVSHNAPLSECQTFIARNSDEIQHRLDMYAEKTLKKDASLVLEDGVYKQTDRSVPKKSRALPSYQGDDRESVDVGYEIELM